MTDNELKFFDPEAGKPLYRVPEGATIPNGMPCGQVDSLGMRWYAEGMAWDTVQHDYPPRFTREPIAPPAPPLPTEPGFYADKDGDLWHVNNSGERALLMEGGRAFEGSYYPWCDDDREYGPFAPVALVPTEMWDRLRVLDPGASL